MPCRNKHDLIKLIAFETEEYLSSFLRVLWYPNSSWGSVPSSPKGSGILDSLIRRLSDKSKAVVQAGWSRTATRINGLEDCVSLTATMTVRVEACCVTTRRS